MGVYIYLFDASNSLSCRLSSEKSLKVWISSTKLASSKDFIYLQPHLNYSPTTENVPKGSQDRPVEDIVIADSGEVINILCHYDILLTF